jgi:hypothetical protein
MPPRAAAACEPDPLFACTPRAGGIPLLTPYDESRQKPLSRKEGRRDRGGSSGGETVDAAIISFVCQ